MDDQERGRIALRAFPLVIAYELWRAFVIGKLWAWFVVPLGAPPMRYGLAFGLLILVDVVVSFHSVREHKVPPNAIERIFTMAGYLAINFGLAALVRALFL